MNDTVQDSSGTTDSMWVWFFALVSNFMSWLSAEGNISFINSIIGCIAGLLAIAIAVRKLMRDKK